MLGVTAYSTVRCAAWCITGGTTSTLVPPYYETGDATATSSTTTTATTYRTASTTATSGLDDNGDNLLSKPEFETAMLEARLSGLGVGVRHDYGVRVIGMITGIGLGPAISSSSY